MTKEEREAAAASRREARAAAQLAALHAAAVAFAGTPPLPFEACDGCDGSGDAHEPDCLRAPLHHALAAPAPAVAAFKRRVQAEAPESAETDACMECDYDDDNLVPCAKHRRRARELRGGR